MSAGLMLGLTAILESKAELRRLEAGSPSNEGALVAATDEAVGAAVVVVAVAYAVEGGAG
jgi:hypothetical protein